MASKDESSSITNPFRVSLATSVGMLLKENGFTDVEPNALESLVEMTQSFISQIGKSSKHYSELANRSQVMVTDVSLALIDSGFPIESMKPYADLCLRKPSRLQPPGKETDIQRTRPLSVNSNLSQPQYVHEGMPNFPDKHSYIQTAAQRHPTTDYQLVRQKASMQRKNAETALTKFIAKTGDSNYYCDETDNPINVAFPLIACKPSALSYLSVLMPKDENEYEVFDLKQEQNLPEAPIKPKRVRIDPTIDNSKGRQGMLSSGQGEVAMELDFKADS